MANDHEMSILIYDYKVDVAHYICEQVVEGKSLTTICGMAGMPDRGTVVRWMNRSEQFRFEYDQARMHQADTMDDFILDTAMACTPATASADSIKIKAFQWRATRLNNKRYGDKFQLTGNNGGPIQNSTVAVTLTTTDPVQAARYYQKMITEEPEQ